ncbi:MAG: LptF/LptG family permease [Saprospiraceae bacterium]|nr:LptF/LptG family permease [Saprospiraceae bacterium]MBK6564875.1 LptF/LptG family permease [Saprospiraceae bacterium]MBK6783021.1 LptF/LptG family permease [Saprospiraceae bacterium]MBK7523519.1 LptF/LptG family permease [Saprospiraceae bacterium]MBK8371493.1 LptF/LptG family permease [Saprospiraceae bacterium]
MLKILDLYIIKKYLSTFFFTMVLITMISITVHYFEMADRFLNANITWKQIVFDFYLHFIPWINGLLWPLFCLLSVIFFTSRMAKNSEVISILSAKISYNRFLRPYFITAIFLGILLWVGNNYIIPQSNRLRNEFEAEYVRKGLKSSLNFNTHFYIGPNEKIYLRTYSSSDSSGTTFRIEKYDKEKLIYILKANSIKYIKETGKWRLSNYEIREINEEKESLKIEAQVPLDTVLAFEPHDFVRYLRQMDMMNTSDLREFVENEKDRGIDSGKKYQIELYRRTADPFTILILTLIGVVVASRKVRGGMGLHLAVGIILGATFVILSKFAVTFSTNLSLPPIIGVWIPNMLFSLVAYLLFRNAQK